MPRKSTVPAYRKHKSTGQAVVTIRTPEGERRDIYLGRYNSPESRREYARIIGTLDGGARPRTTTADQDSITVDEVALAYLRHAERYYRRPDGTQTQEYDEIKRSLVMLRRGDGYGHLAAAGFGPLFLETVRDRMVAAGWCRQLVNKRIGRIKRMFRWAASRQLVKAEVYGSLRLLEGLAAGRTTAREAAPVLPVDPAIVDVALPHLGRHLRAMVQLQRFTGMRPGEVCAMKLAEIDRKSEVWTYRPSHHKTSHRGKSRTILIGPKGRAIIESFIAGGRVVDPSGPMFSPRRARDERFAEMRAKRKSKITPSQVDRRKAKPKLQPAEEYTPHTYAHAIRAAAEKAFPLPEPMAKREGEMWKDWRSRLKRDHTAEARAWRRRHHWHPNQLRHLFATEIRARHGLEAAQVLLGHASANITEVYAERDRELAVRVAAAMG